MAQTNINHSWFELFILNLDDPPFFNTLSKIFRIKKIWIIEFNMVSLHGVLNE